MIEILILYILLKYDATIYKVRKLIKERFFLMSSPSLGAVIPALKRLESLSCVEFTSKMSEGGMLTKTYKITPFGQKYLKSKILSFDFKNKSDVLSNVSSLICVSDVLEEDEKKELFETCKNRLIILKADIEDASKNPYNMYTESQKKVLGAYIALVEKLLGEIL